MDIDFVVLWVDGSDPAWLAEKEKYEPERVLPDGGKNRWRDWGLMPYWFRSVEQYAPWVNKVYFVTWGHLPAFLNTEAPKLKIVKHEDFMPEQYLPSFNSCSIEMNVHRIEGLSEQFVYFNDDLFLMKPVKPEDFFVDGLPCAYGAESPRKSMGFETWEHHLQNCLTAVNRNFSKKEQVKKNRSKYVSRKYSGKANLRTWFLEKLYRRFFVGFYTPHAPAAYLKSTFEEIWEKEPELLDVTCKEKFRSYDQVNQYIAYWWQIAKGDFYPYVPDNRCLGLREENGDEICASIIKQEHRFLCLQDGNMNTGDEAFNALSGRISEAFETILPQKSSFEL